MLIFRVLFGGYGGTGRRTGLKILREQSRAGSIPATRTIFPRGNVLTGIMHETSNLE